MQGYITNLERFYNLIFFIYFELLSEGHPDYYFKEKIPSYQLIFM